MKRQAVAGGSLEILPVRAACIKSRDSLAVMLLLCLFWRGGGTGQSSARTRGPALISKSNIHAVAAGNLSVLMAMTCFMCASWDELDSTDSLAASLTEQRRNKHTGLEGWWITHRLCWNSLYINFDPWFHPFMSVRSEGGTMIIPSIYGTFQRQYKKNLKLSFYGLQKL